MAISLKPSSNTIRASLRAHSGLGLLIAALMYLVCVTGVVSIFYPDFERWEQADIAEFEQLAPAQVHYAVENFIAHYLQQNPAEQNPGNALKNIRINLPSSDMPRLSVGAGKAEYFMHADASLGQATHHAWTHFITSLHYSLTLPGIWGLTLVGIVGIVLISMAISGLLAHPNIFKNAFSLRMDRGARQQQVDLHNRIGVWSTPFIVAIALTGALIGLSQVFLFAFSAVFFKGDSKTITDTLFLADPEPTHIAAPLLNVANIIEKFSQQHPTLQISSITLHHAQTTAQTAEITALIPNRLVWADTFVFNAGGEEIKKLGWSDGAAGAQIYASTYRLHFGHFGGLPVKIIYALLGVGMCFMCTTGMNIWFRRQQQAGKARMRLERAWMVVVWGFPAAILLTAIADFWWQDYFVAIFWLSSAALLVISQWLNNTFLLSLALRNFVVVLALLLVGLHVLHFGNAAFIGASALVNFLLLSVAAFIALSLLAKKKGTTLAEKIAGPNSALSDQG